MLVTRRRKNIHCHCPALRDLSLGPVSVGDRSIAFLLPDGRGDQTRRLGARFRGNSRLRSKTSLRPDGQSLPSRTVSTASQPSEKGRNTPDSRLFKSSPPAQSL